MINSLAVNPQTNNRVAFNSKKKVPQQTFVNPQENNAETLAEKEKALNEYKPSFMKNIIRQLIPNTILAGVGALAFGAFDARSDFKNLFKETFIKQLKGWGIAIAIMTPIFAAFTTGAEKKYVKGQKAELKLMQEQLESQGQPQEPQQLQTQA